MKKVSLIIVCLLVFEGLLSGICVAQEPGGKGVAKDHVDTELQLKVIQTALMQGPTEQNRLDAAVVLLGRGDAQANAVLHETLGAKDNSAALRAICRALTTGKNRVAASKHTSLLKPLIALVVSGPADDSRLVAETMLIFPFEDVLPRLSVHALNGKLRTAQRLNVVYALKLWPDKEAISVISALTEEDDAELAVGAHNTLRELFGIPSRVDGERFREIVNGLLSGSRAEFSRKLLLVQRSHVLAVENRHHSLARECDLWRDKFLAMLDRDYVGADEAGRAGLLVSMLKSELAGEKLWAVGRLSGFAGAVNEELRTSLLGLLSDQNREVRLSVAKLLANKSTLDPAAKLLARLDVEQDGQVALAVFEALGEACFFAFSPGSQIKLSEDIRSRTFELAAKYLASEDMAEAIQGGEVIRKLLELNSLAPEESNKYMAMLVTRYEKANAADQALRGRLLGVMARLCGKTSHKASAGLLYREAFLQGLAEKTDKTDNTVREAAAEGLVNIDRAKAFGLFKARGLIDDASPAVRRTVFSAAAQVGGADDLDWLAGKLSANGDAVYAWQAMVEVLGRQGSEVVMKQADKLADDSSRVQRQLELLIMVEKKASGEKNSAVLVESRWRLLDIYLKAGDIPKAVGVFARRLLEQKDLPEDDPLAAIVELWLGSAEATAAQKTAMVEGLAGIKNVAEAQWPMWEAKLRIWRNKHAAKPTPAAETP